MFAGRWCARQVGDPGDAGTTLAEVLISASLFGVVLMLVGAGLGEMARSAGKSEALSVAQEALRLAWQRLGAEVRYATAIGAPVQVTTDASNWHVVFATPSDCVELRLDEAGPDLDQRDVSAGTGWVTVAPGVTTTAGGAPLVLIADTASGHQGLELNLTMTTGGTRDNTGRSRVLLFTVVNSSVNSTLPAGCAVSV